MMAATIPFHFRPEREVIGLMGEPQWVVRGGVR